MVTTMIFKTTWKIVLLLSSLSLYFIVDYAGHTDLQDYIGDNFIIDYADYTDL